MSEATITEACGCGATFRVSTWSASAQSAATAWRKQHKCSRPTPPGPCWHDSGVELAGEHLRGETYRCELRAGHLGAHECKRGNGHAVWPDAATPPATDRAADGRGGSDDH